MVIVPKYDELQAMTEKDLVERFDAIANQTEVGINFLRQEIALKAQERQTDTMVRLTKLITVMTVVVTVATVINVIVAFLD